MSTQDPFLFNSGSGTLQNHVAPLPAETRSHLRSTQILTCLAQIVSELLQNSLDAGARHVEINVDCDEWSCWVRDDGRGISKKDMNTLAQEEDGGRYGSSKAYTPDSLNVVETFGFRGEALASAACLSCLEISSRTSKSRETWSVILKGGRCLYNGPSTRWRRESPGTVVCVRDAFHNLPIRRLSHPSPSSTLNAIRREIETFSLMFPEVAFSLDNHTVNHTRDGTPNASRIVKIPKTNSILAAFRNLYGRALAEHVDEIDEVIGDLRLHGFISLQGAHSKAYQFLYINRHPVANCDLHHLIQHRFNTSSFAKNAYDEVGETGLPRSTIRRSPRKIERRPVYVLNLTLPPCHMDNCLEPGKASMHLKNKDAVASLLSSVVQAFLVRHGFVTSEVKDRKRIRQEDTPTPPLSPSPSPPPQPSPSKSRKRQQPSHNHPELADRFAPGSMAIHEPDTTANQASLYAYHDISTMDDCDELVWRDPNTGEYFVVDQRSGNSYPRTIPTMDHNGDEGLRMSGRSRRTLSCPVANVDQLEESTPVPHWIQEALEENQAYSLTEPRIPILSRPPWPVLDAHTCPSSYGEHARRGGRQETQAAHHYFRTQLTEKTDTREIARRFTAEDLRNAEIITQVDRKFIACLIDDNLEYHNGLGSGKSLVLIDQHAADERVRVERYLKELCLGFLHWDNGLGGHRIRELSPAIAVLLTRREASQLGHEDNTQMAFRRWGFRFADFPQINPETDNTNDRGNGDDGYVQVWVQAVPEIVGDKLLVGNELRELVKGFLGQLETDVIPVPRSSALQAIRDDVTEFSWMKAMRWCPHHLLDLVNSRACRGAIMFNDTLSLARCEQLVQSLSGTAFPFQCAHGRPSLVPLTSVGAKVGNVNRERRPNVNWAEFGRLCA